MESGGAERVASTLVNAWSSIGYQVVLLPTFSKRGECFYKLESTARLVFLADIVDKSKNSGLFSYLARLRALRRFVVEENPDTLISFLPNVNIMLIIATFGLSKHTVICERTDPFLMPINWTLRFLRLVTYPLASYLVVQTQAVKSKYSKLWRPLPPIACIGNPVPEHFVAHHTPFNRKFTRTLLAVGRLSEEKRFALLINTFASIAEKHPEWSLRIVGEGEMRSKLETIVSSLEMSGRISLPGRTNQIELEFLNSDAFILTSRFEGFPNALLEAMAFGLPCISVDCPSGPYEITNGGQAAILTPPNDPEALRSGLEILMSNSKLREVLSKRAKEFVLEKFSLSEIIALWETVIRPK